MIRKSTLGIAILALLTTFIVMTYGGVDPTKSTASKSDSKLNLDGFTRLLDLLDVIIAKNPDYQATISRLQAMNEQERNALGDELARKNAGDRVISAKIDSLLDSPAYQLYYAQFRNVDSSVHRKIFCNLPYRGISSPGDIGSTLFELCTHRDSVAVWARVIVSKIDLGRCREIARQWLPTADYEIPTVYFIYDGNGGAFAKKGAVGFDLYGSVLGSRSPQDRFANLSSVSEEFIENILAHELHHIFSARYLYPGGRSYATWQEKALDNLVRGFVNEGVAMQCNPPEGFKRDIWTDSQTVKYWIDQVNEKAEALKKGTIEQSEFEQWREKTYQETAFQLLDEFIKRKFPQEDGKKMSWAHASERPDLEHGLGWWMIYKISNDGKDKNKVISLLSDPRKLFAFYNESVQDMPSDFRIAVR